MSSASTRPTLIRSKRSHCSETPRFYVRGVWAEDFPPGPEQAPQDGTNQVHRCEDPLCEMCGGDEPDLWSVLCSAVQFAILIALLMLIYVCAWALWG